MLVSDLNLLLVQILQQKNYKNCQIDYNSADEFGNGFLSDITFVKVNYHTGNEDKKEALNLAVKKSTENETFRDALRIPTIFIQEMFFYDKVFPAFREFQNKKKLKNIFDSIPKCYGNFVEDNVEFIVLENLKALNFTLCDRKKPMGIKELELALVEYGKFHALSLAMNDQEPKLFEEINTKLQHSINAHFRGDMYIILPKLFQQILETLQRKNEYELHEKLKNFIKEKNIVQMTLDLMEEETFYSVVNHCDSWINNLMFQYKDEDKTVPSKLAIIDWQLVSVCNTPIYDLSFLLYVCASVEDLENLPDLLKIYYNSLHSFMKELGSDPDKVFPYDTFLSHWRRYRLFGFMIAPMSMKFLFAENEDLPAECKCVEDTYNWIIDVDFQEKGCEDRVVGLCRRYFCNNV